MDQLDINLHQAWDRTSASVKADRLDALRRAKRQFTLALQRPMRAWCLCIRASDTRISASNAVIEPAPGHGRESAESDSTNFVGNSAIANRHRNRLAARGIQKAWRPACDVNEFGDEDDGLVAVSNAREFIVHGKPHMVTLRGDLIRELTKPVCIPWPGVDWLEAAAKLGRHQYTLRGWMKCGTLQYRREYSRCFGYRGKPKPIVWSSAVLDPNAHNGRAPDPIWGTLWQSMWEQLPEEYALIAVRVPSTRHWNATNTIVQRGWSFICPGRLQRVPNASGEFICEHLPCGRRVGRLYAPQSVWTLGQAMDLQEGIDITKATGGSGRLALAGQWFPGLVDPVRFTGPRSFACHYCWRVRYTSLIDRHGWNDFVTHISGGLLYGHEVERPSEHARPERKRRYAKQSVPHPAPGRSAVLRMLSQGMDEKAIAKARNVTHANVRRHVRTLCAMHGVRTGEQIVAKVRERNAQASRRMA